MMERANEASGAASVLRRDEPRDAVRGEHNWMRAIAVSEFPEGCRS
jgi:hypothetical protein